MSKLTTVELKSIQDQMSSEQLLVKKFQNYAADASDPDIKKQCTNIANSHQEHFNLLKSCLG